MSSETLPLPLAAHSALGNAYAYTGIVMSFMLGLCGSAAPSLLAYDRRRALQHDRAIKSGDGDREGERTLEAKRHASRAVDALMEHPLARFGAGVAAGAIIAVGFVHSFPEGAEALAVAMPGYPYAGLFAMIALLSSFALDQGIALAMGATHADHNRGELARASAGAGAVSDAEGGERWHRAFLVELYTLLAGVTLHSFFVGVNIGLANSAALLVAVVAHQFFEGLAVGMRVLRARAAPCHVATLELVFALACPIGIGVGMATRSIVEARAYTLVNGIVSSLSAGILVYVGCIHLLQEEMQRSASNHLSMGLVGIGVVFGATAMSLIAVWT